MNLTANGVEDDAFVLPQPRKKPTGVDNPVWGSKIDFPLYMFRMRRWCFNFGSERHVYWLLRLRDGAEALIKNIDNELERIFNV